MHKSGKISNDTATNFKKAMIDLFNYCRPYYIFIILACVFSCIASIFSIIGPDKLKNITNAISKGLNGNIDLELVKNLTIFLAIIYIMSAILNYFEHFIMAIVTNKFSERIRTDISKKINCLPLSYFDKTSYGNVLSRVTNDVDTLSQALHNCLSDLISALTLLIGSIIMMFITSGIMAFTAIISSIIGFILMFIIVGKSQKYFIDLQNNLGELNGEIEEVYGGHNIVLAYNATEQVSNDFSKINDELYKSVFKSQFLSGLVHPIMGFIGNFGYVCVCIVGALLTMNGQISFGVIVAFMIYVRLFTQPLSQIGQSISQIQSCAAASERVFEFLYEKEMPIEVKNKKINKNKVEGKIEFKHVSFSYNDKREVIKDFNITVKPGQKVAIVGPTGAGKTTMVNLLMKFYDITKGDILIDGISTKEISRENIHELFIMVLQDTWTFEGTIKDNIIYNKKNVTLSKVIEICKTVGLDHYIKSLPQSYNTIITDNDTLSSGQKQLLTIARGMVEDAPFLILDEATSSVDTRTEELVVKAMDKLTEGRTSFIIAHRLSTIKNADIILMMEDGNIVESGNHEELMKLNKKYANLYNSQFEKLH